MWIVELLVVLFFIWLGARLGSIGIGFAGGLFGDAIEQNGAAGGAGGAENDGHVRINRSDDTLFGANATNPDCPSTVTTSMWLQVAAFDVNWQTMLSHGEGGAYRGGHDTQAVGERGGWLVLRVHGARVRRARKR